MLYGLLLHLLTDSIFSEVRQHQLLRQDESAVIRFCPAFLLKAEYFAPALQFCVSSFSSLSGAETSAATAAGFAAGFVAGCAAGFEAGFAPGFAATKSGIFLSNLLGKEK